MKDQYAYMNTLWFALLPARMKQKVMAWHFSRSPQGRKRLA